LGGTRPELLARADPKQLLIDAERHDLRIDQHSSGVLGLNGQEIMRGAVK
jgi:hypothetical protein